MSAVTTIYPARKIITMYPEQPFAQAAAVKDGRILGVGNAGDLIDWLKISPFTPYEVDPIFEDKILMPGLVDAHTHLELQGLIYSGNFVAQIPWPRPEGGFFPVYPGKRDVLDRLKELDQELPPGDLLYGAAYDENKAGGFLHLSELDEVSSDRPILISNLVFHRFYVNSALLAKAGIDPADPPPGLETGQAGKPTGTLIEAAGLMAVLPALPEFISDLAGKIRRVLPLFTNGGVTTACEASLGAVDFEISFQTLRSLLSEPETRLRVVGLPWASAGVGKAGSLEGFLEAVTQAETESFDALRLGAVKLYTDGSIISRTSPIGWPGYWDGTPEGSMANDPEEIAELLIGLHRAGRSTVTHANSRPGCQVVLDAVRRAQSIQYRPDMRHRIDHAYNITEAQLRTARELGVALQFFTTQIYYYGDAHLSLQGPDRARHLGPVGTAARLGVSWGFHNDPPGAPQAPWLGAWVAVNRLTESGIVLGPEHRASVADALRAMTIEAAYQLHLDHEIGSISFGKKADFCVLEADPLAMDPMELKDMPVWGTVFGGRPAPARGRA